MAKLIINEENKKSRIEPEVYGHFSEHLGRCIYEGIYVGDHSEIPNVNGMRIDVVEALKELKVPMLRWPGGCFADEYHWKDGIGPKENRKKMINTHWGGVVEDNSFGTHEFMELCRQLGCKTYVNGNLGSGTVQEMSEWVEYMTFDGVSPMADLRKANGHAEPWKIDFFGVGNEMFGIMTRRNRSRRFAAVPMWTTISGQRACLRLHLPIRRKRISSMDLWIISPFTIMYIQRAGRSKEALLTSTVRCGIRLWEKHYIWMNW